MWLENRILSSIFKFLTKVQVISLLAFLNRFEVTGSGNAATIKLELSAFTQAPTAPFLLPFNMTHIPNFTPIQNKYF